MDKFQIIKNIGDGTYGTVVEAINKQTHEIVAIKKMKKKFGSWEECMSLREIKHLRKLNHANVIKLKEVIRVANELFLIFEFIKGTVLDLIRENQNIRGNRGAVREDTIRHIISQCLKGISYCHDQSIFHRDLKPENLLYAGGILKIADFGLAKEFNRSGQFSLHTSYVSTRWYRAPEIIL